MKKRNHYKLIFTLTLITTFSLLLFTTGCGKKKTKKKDKNLIENFTITDVTKGSSIDNGKKSYSDFMKTQFPSYDNNNRTEQDEYIDLKAELTVYMLNGGKFDNWLKKRQIPKDHWGFLDSYYRMNPMVKRKIKIKIKNLLEKH
jgi:hypothetical protein